AIVLMGAALVQAWSLPAPSLALAALPLVLLYAVTPGLRRTTGFRVGLVGWVTFAALFALAAGAGTAYPAQAPLLVFLAPVWLALGCGVRGTRLSEWAGPLYACGALLVGLCGIVSLLQPAGEGSWQVFLVGGVVFTALFLILRQDVFAYLLTLSLALLAYDWVKASTSTFTQDVFFYLVIGTAVLGVFFLLPLVKRLADRVGTVPMISIFTWRGAGLTAVPVLCGGVLVLSAYSVKITEHPKFCTSCHNMGKYYESWQHSSHADVACVQCHYEPGVEAELEGKMAGMIQLVKYVSHAYDTKPHAEISNASCMRGGCHADMDHNKQTVLFHGKVKFSHERHLSGHPRGKELNCVSCHGQVVEGQHISVAETACLTCHFYGRGAHPVAAGDCKTCHTVPQQPVTFLEQPFDHAEFLKGKPDVRCEHCHSQVTQGDGHVSATRCRSCHLERMPESEDQERFHLVHVSEGHFDCLQCHDEIRHGQGLKPHEMMASGNCATCHGDQRHSIQERIYAGQAVEDVEPLPDVMFKAGVACDGCHIETKTERVGVAAYTRRVAGPQPCADCHGEPDYGLLLTEWQRETRQRLGGLTPRLASLERACQSAEGDNGKVDAARTVLAAARNRLECVERDGSYGAHNYAYTASLLDRAEAELDKGAALLNGHTSQESGE
ncbi:MAG: NapC/NirT family cytochrome c, partial [Planctomycetota bacterium]